MRNIDKYTVFQKSHELVLKIYEITNRFPKEELYGLSLQMRRAAYSIPMNLKEGGRRKWEGIFKVCKDSIR